MTEETRREITSTTHDSRIREEIVRMDGLASFDRSFGLMMEGGEVGKSQTGEREGFR